MSSTGLVLIAAGGLAITVRPYCRLDKHCGREVCASQSIECLRSSGRHISALLCAPGVRKVMEHVISAEVSTHAFLQPVDKMAETLRVSCSSLRSFVRERMLLQLRDARQKHAGRLRLLTKSEMPCTQVVNSSREPRLTRIVAYFQGPEEIVSDILFARRTATLGALLHILMAYSFLACCTGCVRLQR